MSAVIWVLFMRCHLPLYSFPTMAVDVPSRNLQVFENFRLSTPFFHKWCLGHFSEHGQGFMPKVCMAAAGIKGSAIAKLTRAWSCCRHSIQKMKRKLPLPTLLHAAITPLNLGTKHTSDLKVGGQGRLIHSHGSWRVKFRITQMT